jgi:hypothetical protein
MVVDIASSPGGEPVGYRQQEQAEESGEKGKGGEDNAKLMEPCVLKLDGSQDNPNPSMTTLLLTAQSEGHEGPQAPTLTTWVRPLPSLRPVCPFHAFL